MIRIRSDNVHNITLIYIYKYINECVLYVFLNGWTNFDETFCVCLNGFRDDLDSRLNPVGTIRGGAQTGILRFMDIFVYK